MIKCGVIGGGSWGTALARELANKGQATSIYVRNKKQYEDMKKTRINERYLPGIELPENLEITNDINQVIEGKDMLVFAVPTNSFRKIAELLENKLDNSVIIVNVAKGIEQNTLMRISEISKHFFPNNEFVALSGPTHAEEVAIDDPTMIVAASENLEIAEKVQNAFISDSFRVYTNHDLIGVELAGALKNIIALGAGILSGLGFGDNSLAALMTRGMSEISRLGIAMGAQADTFLGLAGVGDLIVTCTSEHSRNRQCGKLIGQGLSVEEAIDKVGMVVEGIKTVSATKVLADKYKIDMPITETLYKIIYEGMKAKDSVSELMQREKKHEMEGISRWCMARKKKISKFKILLIILLVSFFVMNIFGGKKRKIGETSRPIKTEYINKLDVKGYLIMDEKTYTSQGEGVVDYNVIEGMRVSKDSTIANLSLMTDVSNLKDELLKVQSAIEYKNQSLNPSLENYEISDKEINLINSIQDALISKNLQNALIAIDTLELNTKKNIDISEISDLINLSNQELEDRRDELSKDISTNNVIYKSEISGIVSYKIDGLEDKFTIKNIPEIDYEFIMDNQPKELLGQLNSVNMGDPLYKLIDNYLYYIAIPIEDKSYISEIKTDDEIELLIDSRISLNGVVDRINTKENSSVLIVKVNEKLKELGYERVHDVGIIKEKNKTFVIKTGSVVEYMGQTGVYVKELNGIVKFKPIDIIVQKDLDTLVDTGDSKGNIILDDGTEERTIAIFDEIIDDPSKIEEGQIIR